MYLTKKYNISLCNVVGSHMYRYSIVTAQWAQ